MNHFNLLAVAAAMAARCLLWTAPAVAETACSNACPATASPARVLGINYAGNPVHQIDHFTKSELLGALKMSGTWVSKLPADRFAPTARRACRYATERGQDFYLQLPVTYSDRQIAQALEALAAGGCVLKGVSIGNEVERLVTERIVARYRLADYVADYNRMVPLVLRHYPRAQIIALELASFTTKDVPATADLRTRYGPIFDWLLPFLGSTLVRKPDFVSVHYYPFTGAQREWETLAAGRLFDTMMEELAPHLGGTPPLWVGEFNTTYQYEADTVYPDSGGDSFMAALTLPSLLANRRIAGFFHWSLVEPVPSTLGLYQGESLTPSPMMQAYRMLEGIWNRSVQRLPSARANVEVFTLADRTTTKWVLVNTGPFFRRDFHTGAVGGGASSPECGCAATPIKVTLPPMSLTTVEQGGPAAPPLASPSPRRFAYADRVIRNGEWTSADREKPYCTPLARFDQVNLTAEHAVNRRYNQNAKVGTGGTPTPLTSPGGRTQLRRESSVLAVQCALPANGAQYHQCGVKIPLVTDEDGDRQRGADWEDGLAKGFIRLKLESTRAVDAELHLGDFSPELLGFNTHHRRLRLDGLSTIDVPIRELAQTPGAGVAKPLAQILSNVAHLRLEIRAPGYVGEFRLHRVDVCDRL